MNNANRLTLGMTILAVCLLLNAVVGSAVGTYTFVIGQNESFVVLTAAYLVSGCALVAWWGIVKLRKWAWFAVLAFAVAYISSDLIIGKFGDPVSEVGIPLSAELVWLVIWSLLAYYVYKKTVAAPNQSLKSRKPQSSAS